jgi:hypothetical protein
MDIFLYPANVAGLTVLGIIIGIPIIIRILLVPMRWLWSVSPPAGICYIVFGHIGIVVYVILIIYLYWYLAECIRDSANGGLRAVDTIGKTPSLGELLLQILKIVLCFIACWGPAIFYFLYPLIDRQTLPFLILYSCLGCPSLLFKPLLHWWLTQANNTEMMTLYSLVVYAVCFSPMALLAVIMFDAISGLNPVLIIGSIYSTFLSYCGLILSFCAFGYIIVKITQLLEYVTFMPEVWSYVSQVIIYCLLMVMAHILGRFYWRYKDKLRWDV